MDEYFIGVIYWLARIFLRLLQSCGGYGRITSLGKQFPDMLGGMAEWTKAAVLKTAVGDKPTGGSNPSPSAFLWWWEAYD